MSEQDTTKCKYCGRMVIHPCPDCYRDWGHGCCGTCGGRQYVGEHHSHEQCLGFQLQDAKAQIDAAWQMIESEYDVEPRAQLEKEAATNGFKYGLAQAVHHIWKREPKVQAVWLTRGDQVTPDSMYIVFSIADRTPRAQRTESSTYLYNPQILTGWQFARLVPGCYAAIPMPDWNGFPSPATMPSSWPIVQAQTQPKEQDDGATVV